MNKKLMLATLAMSVGLVLSGCGGGNGSESNPEPTTDKEYANVYSKEVKTKDGRTVQCVVMEGYKLGGLDCDW